MTKEQLIKLKHWGEKSRMCKSQHCGEKCIITESKGKENGNNNQHN